MSNFWKRLAVLAGFACVLAGAQTQRTTVTKRMTNNPSIGIVDYQGSAEGRKKLEEILERSGWLTVLPGSQAGTADIQMNAIVRTDGQICTSVRYGQEAFQTERSGEIASLETVDDILERLFKVKGLCTSKIYYVVTGQGNLKELYCCYLDGSAQERVTNNNAISTEPSFGHKNAMVYTLARNNMLHIVLSDMSRNVQKIISSAPGLNSSAGLSHDGTKLALPMSLENQVDLYVLDLKSGQRFRLTKDRNVESSPCWSPNGSQLCYVSDKLGVPQLYLRNAAPGTQEKRISTGGVECVSPDWSNISNRLCFSMKTSSGRVIAVMDMGDTSYTVNVVTNAAGDWEAPAWGPDGRHIICTRGAADGSRDLYIIDSWSKSFRAVSKGARLSLPAWRPAY